MLMKKEVLTFNMSQLLIIAPMSSSISLITYMYVIWVVKRDQEPMTIENVSIYVSWV